MKEQTQHLIIAAAREAQMVSALARLLLSAAAITIFLLSGGRNLPVAPIVLSYLGFYAFISLLSGLFALKSLFRTWMGTVFTAIDGMSLGLFVAFVIHITGSPVSYFQAVPGFIFIFCIMILATMRYTTGPILAAFFSFFFTLTAALSVFDQGRFSETFDISVVQVNPEFFFGNVQNTARWGFVAITALLGFFVVRRRRKMLESAIILGHKEANLARYLPNGIAQLVAEQGIDALSRGQRKKAAVLFVDIRGFTGISETTTPEDLSLLLSEFRSVVSKEIEARSGIVDKFIGDAVMAVFGVSTATSESAANGLGAAIQILKSLENWNIKRVEQGQIPLKVSMGLHYGEVFAGAIGSEERMEFTVLGDTVNVAARLQESAKDTTSGLAVSKSLLEAASELKPEKNCWHEMENASIRGRHGEITHFSYTE